MTYLFGGFFLACSNLLLRDRKSISWLKLGAKANVGLLGRDLALILLVTLCGGVLAPYLFLLGLGQTTAVSAALLANTESLFTVGIAVIFFGERGRPKDYAAITLLVVGAVVLTTNLRFYDAGAAGSVLGNLLVAAGCLFWGIDNNLSRLLTIRRSILQLGSVKGIVGGALLLVATSSYAFRPPLDFLSVLYLVMVGVFSVGLSLLLFLFSLRRIGAMRTGVIFSTSSFFGAISAFLVLRETISAVQMLAGLLMFVAIYVLSIPPKRRGQA